VPLVGRETPRLATAPIRKLTPHTTLGYEAADFIETFLGLELLPWQRWWLLNALEVDSNGDFVRRTIVTLVSRQCGKTTLLKALSLWMLYMGRARLVLGSAQSLDIARESWQGAVELAEGDPELAAEIDSVRRANGEQTLSLTNGARYKITAATRSAGRGLSVDLLILDEVREHRDWSAWSALSKTTMARPNALTIVISNAGDDESVVLNALRDTALAGTDPSIAIYEWSGPDGCAIDDPDAWQQAIPGLGHTITEGAVRSALASDPPAVFRTEMLCQRVASLDSAIDLSAWRDCADAEATMESARARVKCALDVAPNGHTSLLAGALTDDDRVQVEVVAAWDSPAAARKELRDLLERVNPQILGWLPNGPAAALAADLRGLKIRTEEIKSDVPAVCQSFAEAVQARRIRHTGDPLLTAQVSGTSKLVSGDGWRFSRKTGGSCDSVYAAAAVVWLVRTAPSVGRPRIVMAS